MRPLLYFILILFISCDTSSHIVDRAKSPQSDITYDIQDVLITTRDGATISGMVARCKGDIAKRPVILQYTIYVRDQDWDLQTIKASVDKGYIGVIAYTRGKRHSHDEIWPYEYDANDTYDVIDWISRQEWSDGRIGMYGGSYNGFTQWAACKNLHPALKTIVPYVTNRPGMGLPMENNVFLNANYEWAFYVGNNRYLDTVANDRQRTWRMTDEWWASGVAYKQMDSIDQRANKLFQRWVDHPSFDDYWQDMAPYEEDFSQINIPVLTIDGYYNDSQNSSLYFLREHYKYHPEAEHYLIIGPYGHFGAQLGGFPEVSGYKVDQGALIDTYKITYEWFDYIFKDGAKPEVLKDKINYQVMGANQWRSVPSIDQMSNDHLKLYLTDKESDNFYSLKSEKPQEESYLRQSVDFADRDNWHNNNYYPNPIILDELNTRRGFTFVSEPMEESMLINGSFGGEIVASINKKDMDIGVTLFELMPDGQYFHLSYIIFRASYAKDITERDLLSPGAIETIPFTNTHLVSKKLSKGSRLVVYLDINKNPFCELNYGTGRVVAEESIEDAKDPLLVQWYNSSFVEIPIWREQ